MDIDIRTLLSRLDGPTKAALERGAARCVQQTHYNVEVEHLLLELLQPPAPEVESILSHFTLPQGPLAEQVQKALESFKRGNARTPALSPNLAPLLQEAWLLSSMLLGQQQIRAGTLILAMLEVDAVRGALLETAPNLLQIPRQSLRKALPHLLESVSTVPLASALRQPVAVQSAVGPMPHNAVGTQPALDQYTVDLCAMARAGRIDPIRGRDAEIRQLIDVLLRRRQNNPILTGEAGVGKTAVVEGLAQRIVEGRVPPALHQVRLCALDLALLQAGAGIKGEFERRLKDVIAEVKGSSPAVILFIDEAHQLIGAGGVEGQGDAANLLKPALARGELRTIAATTWAEYKKYVERDPALARRFQVVKVEEPSEMSAIDMLYGIVPTLQKHHKVNIHETAVRDAVRLSHRYITGRQLPDKAISVLDTACARVAIAQNGPPEALEDLERRMQSIRSALQRWKHAHATGEQAAAPMQALEQEIAECVAQHKTLAEQWALERNAVDEIRALRSRIANLVESAETHGNEELPWMTSSLTRLESGLQAIRNEQPMVPVHVDGAAVAAVVSAWTGIPVGKMVADEMHTVLHLKDRLRQWVLGQDAALESIARRVQTQRAGLEDPDKPIGVFLLVGPSGVGKTETAHALADALYGGVRSLVTVNMSEFQEAHSVSSLKGAPPGYVGFGKGGVLTEAVRRRPYCVVLLDEMEKAHPDVLELFFQVFDKGTMDDGEGTPIDFRNTLILLTSNAAQEVITRACAQLPLPSTGALVDALRPELLRRFSPAFLGRITIVPYYPLGDVQLRAVVRKKLEQLAQRMVGQHRATLVWDAGVENAIAVRCTDVESGARNVDSILAQTLLPMLSTAILERMAMNDTIEAIAVSVAADGHWTLKFDDAAREASHA